jgi:hypothetical protein
MPYIDIDIEDIYSDLSDREKTNLVEWLKEDGFLTNRDTEYDSPPSPLQQLFVEDLEKIRNSYFQISKNDFDMINNIAKKY